MGFAPSAMQLKSNVFNQDGLIPSKYTGEGEDVSPALSWTDAPDGTKEFAIICHDPDAPLVSPNGTYGFVHWVLYNIPGDVNSLEEGTAQFSSGKNDFGEVGYNGPMPPNGHGFTSAQCALPIARYLQQCHCLNHLLSRAYRLSMSLCD